MNESQLKSKSLMPVIKGVTDTREADEPLPAEAPPASTATSKTAKTTTAAKKLAHLSAPGLMKKVEEGLDKAIGESKVECTPAMKGFLRSVLEKHLKAYISEGFVVRTYVNWHRAQLAAAKKLRAELK